MKPSGKPYLRKFSSKQSIYDQQRNKIRQTLDLFGDSGDGGIKKNKIIKRYSSPHSSEHHTSYATRQWSRASQKRVSSSLLSSGPQDPSTPGQEGTGPAGDRRERLPDIVVEDTAIRHGSTESGKLNPLKRRTSQQRLGEEVQGERSLEQKRKSGNNKRLKRQLLRRKLLGDKWRNVVRCFCVLYRLWKIHSNRVTDILEQFDSLDMIVNSRNSKQDLLFDLADYKAHKEAQVTQEAKRVLKLTPGTRTEKDLHNVRVALRNYPSMIEYPVHMQHMMAARAWYECYDSKRVILREGHAPMNFYFILTGSVLVSKYDKEKKANKTVCFLSRGDNFGDSALLDKTARKHTVISKEKVELFCLSDDDYMEIFMSGGLNNPDDPFLMSISCLRGWPTNLLIRNQHKAVFAYFRRKTVLAEDTQNTDWIFIVKSGSASVMKKLRKVEPPGRKQGKKRKPEVIEEKSHEAMVEERLQLTLKVTAEHQGMFHQFHLPEINIETLPTYTRKNIRQEEEDKTPSPFITKSASAINPPVSIMVTTDDKPPRRLSLLPPPSPPSLLSPIQEIDPTAIPTPRIDHRKLFSADEEDEQDQEPVFVVVQTLTKGSVFGLADIVYGHQPSFSLVSNGAEIIKINKKLYTDNADQRVMTRLREEIYPYPTDEEMQDQLSTRVSWDANRMDCLLSTLRKLKVKHSDLVDARTSLKPEIVQAAAVI